MNNIEYLRNQLVSKITDMEDLAKNRRAGICDDNELIERTKKISKDLEMIITADGLGEQYENMEVDKIENEEQKWGERDEDMEFEERKEIEMMKEIEIKKGIEIINGIQREIALQAEGFNFVASRL